MMTQLVERMGVLRGEGVSPLHSRTNWNGAPGNVAIDESGKVDSNKAGLPEDISGKWAKLRPNLVALPVEHSYLQDSLCL